jgi:hypothetical protein
VRPIAFGRFRITGRFTENIDKLLDEPAVADGEAAGLLEKLDAHGEAAFALFPPIGGPIVCQFGREMLEQVKAAVTRNVTVYGKLMCYLGSSLPGRAKVVRLTARPDDDELPSLNDLRGAFHSGAAYG